MVHSLVSLPFPITSMQSFPLVFPLNVGICQDSVLCLLSPSHVQGVADPPLTTHLLCHVLCHRPPEHQTWMSRGCLAMCTQHLQNWTHDLCPRQACFWPLILYLMTEAPSSFLSHFGNLGFHLALTPITSDIIYWLVTLCLSLINPLILLTVCRGKFSKVQISQLIHHPTPLGDSWYVQQETQGLWHDFSQGSTSISSPLTSHPSTKLSEWSFGALSLLSSHQTGPSGAFTNDKVVLDMGDSAIMTL